MNDTRRLKPYRRSLDQQLEIIRVSLLSQVEIAPDYSISRWRSERTMAWAGNEAVPKDLAEEHRKITDSIVKQVMDIARKFISNTESRLDEETVAQLRTNIESCAVLTEELRPMAGKGWPPSPRVGLNGEVDCANTMIEQIRAEVKRCNNWSASKDVRRF